jgi:putative DNA primase/helicase
MMAELYELNAWKQQLQMGDRGPKRNLTNLILHLRNLDGLGKALRFNELTQQTEWNGRSIEDPDYIDIRLLIERVGFQPTDRDVRPAVDRVARENRFNPVVEYLTTLNWDGTPRLDRWMHKLLGAPDTPFVRTISAKVLISAVARALEPGCQVDTVLVLEGEQGIRKSSAIAAMFGRDYTRESVSLFDSHQRMVMNMMGAWVIELAEFVAIARSHHNGVKGLISMRHDTVVLPYAKSSVTLPRRCIMIASVNPEGDGYLTDNTGNRRYWPVQVTKVDLDGINARRDQIWAEALHRYREGERWWLEGDENNVAGAEQDDRGETEAWTEPLGKKIDEESARRGVAITWITNDEAMTLLGIPHERKDKKAQMRIGNALKELGFTRDKQRPDALPGERKGKPKSGWKRQ